MNSTQLPEEIKSLLLEEESILASVLDSLRSQKKHDTYRYSVETDRARELTAQIVGSRRVEEKSQAASDEAVAHGLSKQKLKDVATIEHLLKRPYFARVALEEEDESGKTRRIEFKLGTAANPDCRIIDWRKAPLAKLYYEYREGDEYSEEIQGKSRNGRVVMRRTIEVEKGSIQKITLSSGSYIKRDGEWKLEASPTRSRTGTGGLPDVLSLITAEQFRTITTEAENAVLIQGIAGSGKTTVALYRLAWLLNPDNSPLLPSEALVIVQSEPLKFFVQGALPRIGIDGVRILTFDQLAAETITATIPALKGESDEVRRPSSLIPSSIDRALRSKGLLTYLEEYASTASGSENWQSYAQDLSSVLSNSRKIVSLDDSKLLSEDLVKAAKIRVEETLSANTCDQAVDALLVRLIERRTGGVKLKDGSTGKYKHIVADEIQDLSTGEIGALIGAVEDPAQLTLVGDLHQRTERDGPFPGWDALRKSLSPSEVPHSFVSLSVSHRSTLPIMRFAEHIQGKALATSGREGRVPIWFRTNSESAGISAARDWLGRAVERYPDSITAVICEDAKEARYVESVLAPSLGGAVRLGTERSFTFEKGVVITWARAVKGLEFLNVLLWNPTVQKFPGTPEMRNLLYIAVSRAEENLCIVTWGVSSPLLPHFGSKLIRSVEA